MTPSSTATPRPVARAAAVLALLALYYVMALTAAAQKSMTFDELAHLTGGYSYWTQNDYRLHPENGNWPQRLGALPALLGGARFPSLQQPAWTKSDVYAIGDQFLYSSGNDAGTLLQRGRAVDGARRRRAGRTRVSVGQTPGLARGRVGQPRALRVLADAAGARRPGDLGHVVGAVLHRGDGAMWAALHRVTPVTVLGGAVLLAGAFLSKLSAPILVPVALVMVTVRRPAAGR